MAVLNLLSTEQQNFSVVSGECVDWHTPGMTVTDNGFSSLIVFGGEQHTINLKQVYEFAGDGVKRLWLGTNNISYSTGFYGADVGFTIFAQCQHQAKAKIIIYEVDNDPYHNDSLDQSLDDSWYLQWADNYPYDGVLTSWPFDAEDVDLETFFNKLVDEENLNGKFIELDINAKSQTVDGLGLLFDGKWDVLRSDYLTLSNSSAIRKIGIFVEIEILDDELTNDEASVYFSFPCLAYRYEMLFNNVAIDIYSSLPEVFRTLDSRSEINDARLFRLIDVYTYLFDVMEQYVDNYAYYDISEGFRTYKTDYYSRLVNPDYAPLPFLYWLSQFISAKTLLAKPTSTPWYSLPGTWSEIVNAADSNTDSILTWSELEVYAPNFENVEDYLRWAIKYGFVSINSGTEESMTETIKQFLTDSKTVTVDKFPGSGPYTIKVSTILSETPDAVGGVGGTSEAVLKAINVSKPLGIYVEHEIV